MAENVSSGGITYEGKGSRWGKPTAAQVAPPPGTAPPVVAWCAVVAPTPLRYTGTTVQQVQAALTFAFGKFPIKLNRNDHLAVLRGMCAASFVAPETGGAGFGVEPYQMLYDALERFGEIEVRDKL